MRRVEKELDDADEMVGIEGAQTESSPAHRAVFFNRYHKWSSKYRVCLSQYGRNTRGESRYVRPSWGDGRRLL